MDLSAVTVRWTKPKYLSQGANEGFATDSGLSASARKHGSPPKQTVNKRLIAILKLCHS